MTHKYTFAELLKIKPSEMTSEQIKESMTYLGKFYVLGDKAYNNDKSL